MSPLRQGLVLKKSSPPRDSLRTRSKLSLDVHKHKRIVPLPTTSIPLKHLVLDIYLSYWNFKNHNEKGRRYFSEERQRCKENRKEGSCGERKQLTRRGIAASSARDVYGTLQNELNWTDVSRQTYYCLYFTERDTDTM